MLVKSKKKLQKGLSLIEASMVLALSAIVVSGVMYYYQSASDNNKTQNTVSELMSIVSSVNGLYAGQQNYNGLNEKVLYNTSAVPENYKNSATQGITHPFGDSIQVGPIGVNGENGYYVFLNKIPKAACINLATMNFGTSMAGVGVGVTSSGLASSTNPTPLTSATNVAAGTIYAGAFNPTQASTVCNQDYNDIGYMLK
ncbi:type 4 pilus major pilin [Escherichia coli]|uniref:type 4 pilus major pilin n=1 Tax=Escherichia coli TaxID=562 RepID=UPI00199A754A|nr:type 4 pilus major pilin [Escherichia coli]EEU9261452.1 pilus assembly protein [Escherichia coli]EIR2337468.1 pilus assembly protein [Escherichia coli]MCQ0124540.1 pilus assembly protein [Escherichia coli]MCQ0455962.1 pilus assembly protein [Escherichia coli]HAM9616859.1 pilus assembly protein [Escherichia coli]